MKCGRDPDFVPCENAQGQVTDPLALLGGYLAADCLETAKTLPPITTINCQELPPLSPLPAIKAAYVSPTGLAISVYDVSNAASDLVLDHSVSITLNTLPQGMYGGPPTNQLPDAVGTIVNPDVTLQDVCSFIADAATDQREKATGKLCGPTLPAFPESGECDPAWTAEDYANAYYFEPIVGHSWKARPAACSFPTGDLQKMLAAERALWDKTTVPTNEATWTTYAKRGSSVTGYNEVVVDSFTIDDVASYFWAHEGDFRAPGATDQALCRFAAKLCVESKKLPLIEMASQYPHTGPFDWSRVSAWRAAVANGGYNADDIFREMSWDDVCDWQKNLCHLDSEKTKQVLSNGNPQKAALLYSNTI